MDGSQSALADAAAGGKYGFAEEAFVSPKFSVDEFVADCRMKMPLETLQTRLGKHQRMCVTVKWNITACCGIL